MAQSSRPGQGAAELGFPGPVLGKMQRESARRASESSGQGEDSLSERLDSRDPLTEADAGYPASEVVGQHLDGQLRSIGGEAARGKMVQGDAVHEVSDGIFDLDVAAVVGLQF